MSFKKLDEPHARLFCFPHAGGGAQAYKEWSEQFPTVEVQAINLPGRGNRQNEKPITELAVLVRSIVNAIRHQLDLPYAFFGHSWGSVLAFEVQVCPCRFRILLQMS
jgi:surfactin synthase thioesterase subunit